jgi:hypothetical protein
LHPENVFFFGSCWSYHTAGVLASCLRSVSLSLALFLFLLSLFWCLSATKTMGGIFSPELKLNMVHVKGRIFM